MGPTMQQVICFALDLEIRLRRKRAQLFDPNKFASPVAIVGSAERAAPRADFRSSRFHQPSR